MEEKKEIGARIRFIRQVLGLSGRALAKTLKISPATLSHWETGKREVSASFLQEIAEKFLICGDFILTGKGPLFSVFPSKPWPFLDFIDLDHLKKQKNFIKQEILYHARVNRQIFFFKSLKENKEEISSFYFLPNRKAFFIPPIEISFLKEISSASEIQIFALQVLEDENQEEFKNITEEKILKELEHEEIDSEEIENINNDNDNIIDDRFNKIQEIRNFLIQLPEFVDLFYQLLEKIIEQKEMTTYCLERRGFRVDRKFDKEALKKGPKNPF